MYRNSSWTGRAPRSLEQAFGPYSRFDSDMTERGHSVVTWLATVALCVLSGLIVAGVL